MTGNQSLINARMAKRDEFYTQLINIEEEMTAYHEHNPDVFKDKTILLPCDDPEFSNFTKFFVSRFQEYGIKKLISTSYANGDEVCRGKIFILDKPSDGVVDVDNLQWEYLEGNGEFSSEEVTALRDDADMIITNPPFSLFRAFMDWLVEGDVLFSVIGNMNAIIYKRVFPLIEENKIWLGVTMRSGAVSFRVPNSYTLTTPNFTTDEEGNNYIHLSNTRWFTNIHHGFVPDPIPLITMEENLRSNKRIISNPNSYKTYENYDAIEVPFTAGIPSDYNGVMGVPISFMNKYNPKQFEIVGGIYGNDGKYFRYTMDDGTSKTPYSRILIRHRRTL